MLAHNERVDALEKLDRGEFIADAEAFRAAGAANAARTAAMRAGTMHGNIVSQVRGAGGVVAVAAAGGVVCERRGVRVGGFVGGCKSARWCSRLYEF